MIYGLCNNDVTKLNEVKKMSLNDSLEFIAFISDSEQVKKKQYDKMLKNKGI